MGFKNKATLLQKNVVYEELKFKDYKNFIKSFFGDEIDPEIIFLNTKQVLLTTTCLSEQEIKNLNFIDYLLLLLNIRSTSIGNIVNLYTTDDNGTQLKIELLINSVVENITSKIDKKLLEPTTTNDITIQYKLPSVEDILFFETSTNCSVPTFFVQKIQFKNEDINLDLYSYKDREQLIKSLPVKVALVIDQKVSNIYTVLNALNLFETIKSETFNRTLPITTNSEILAFIIKLLFNTDLEGLYNSFFVLCKAGNLTGEFLNNCSPGEFYLFTKKIEEMNQQNKSSNTQQQYGSDNLPPINSEADFGFE